MGNRKIQECSAPLKLLNEIIKNLPFASNEAIENLTRKSH